MNSRRKPTNSNPWNKNPPKKAPSTAIGSLSNVSSTNKFKEAQKKIQASVHKHIKEYESSSEEEDVESYALIEKITANYTSTGGPSEKLSRTETYLKDTLVSGATTCLICISKVKRDDQIWTCSSCYCCFHLMCIQRWSKDSISQRKQALQGQIVMREIVICWGCPKCRKDYGPESIPTQYKCYCQKKINPVYQTLLAPHSCGEICGKGLEPPCGHKCLLLCHPGPCPPCPVTVNARCYCGAKPPRLQRCSDKYWSCGGSCGKLLECAKHHCDDPCHAGDCKPCSKKSIQKCMCKSSAKLRDCSSPIWQCEKVCGKNLDCGKHKCMDVCHAGECNVCHLSLPRICPCGKSKYHLPCTEETPTCLDTCDKLLECGMHNCILKCHKDRCGTCLEIVEKQCRCGQHTKEVHCSKPFYCETKCKNMKDCNKHPCNKKCCDGNCPPCEKPCGKTLSCGNHKCASVCHRGPCYPCSFTEIVTCNCGDTKLTVPCGRKHKVKPPKCVLLCKAPPDCHHETREPHRCHFGNCPPCKQICNRTMENCPHICPSICHDAVMIKIETAKASAPWEEVKPQKEKRSLPCPECIVPVSVECLGRHEISSWPCHLAKPGSCFRPCGRILTCENHKCTLPCHIVSDSPDSIKFWDWFVHFSDLKIHWKNEPTYILSQFAFIFGGIATLLHSLIRGGRLPYLWLGIFLHGVVVECMSYALPNVDNFWHSQTPIIFLGRRFPLHIMLLYPCFNYNASVGVAKLRLPNWAEPFAVGLCSVLIDIPYDIISVNYLHWTWHDTDPNIEDRHYWVPWNSYYFHSTFACSFTFFFHYTRSKICHSGGKWIADKSVGKELVCTVIAALLGTPGGILLFLPIYHPLHDLWKIHSEVTYFILFTIFLCIIWTGERKPKLDYFFHHVKHQVHWSTWILITHLVIHYATFFFIPIIFNAEDEIAIGLKEPIGPCHEYVPVQTIFGVLKKRKWLCATDYDEKYFNWSCLSEGKPPSAGSYWYTACGVPLPNRMEYIAVITTICILAATIFGNLHFKSSGDAIFNYKDSESEISSKKKR